LTIFVQSGGRLGGQGESSSRAARASLVRLGQHPLERGVVVVLLKQPQAAVGGR
jgi:hypothetical protein